MLYSNIAGQLFHQTNSSKGSRKRSKAVVKLESLEDRNLMTVGVHHGMSVSLNLIVEKPHHSEILRLEHGQRDTTSSKLTDRNRSAAETRATKFGGSTSAAAIDYAVALPASPLSTTPTSTETKVTRLVSSKAISTTQIAFALQAARLRARPRRPRRRRARHRRAPLRLRPRPR